jgi:hypothetical protein
MATSSNPVPTEPPTWTADQAALSQSPDRQQAGDPSSFSLAAPIRQPAARKNRATSGTALLVLGALVAVGGVTFAAGRVTAPSGSTTSTLAGAGRGAGTGTGGAGAPGGLGGSSVTGTVVSIDGSSIQIKLASGTTETLDLGSSVTYRDATTGSAADVTPGSTVQIGLSFAGSGTGPTASGNPRPSGGVGGLGNATVGTITVVQ